MLTESNSHVSVCLDITEELPSEFALQRWLAEPIKAATISTSVFLTNKKGYPVLSRPHQPGHSRPPICRGYPETRPGPSLATAASRSR